MCWGCSYTHRLRANLSTSSYYQKKLKNQYQATITLMILSILLTQDQVGSKPEHSTERAALELVGTTTQLEFSFHSIYLKIITGISRAMSIRGYIVNCMQ